MSERPKPTRGDALDRLLGGPEHYISDHCQNDRHHFADANVVRITEVPADTPCCVDQWSGSTESSRKAQRETAAGLLGELATALRHEERL